jgi:hypothetical protein
MKENQRERSSQADETGKREQDERFSNAKINQQSEKEKESEDEFPGYPHYPASEDIMNPANHIARVPVDVENLSPAVGAPKLTETPTAEASASTNTGEDLDVPGAELDDANEEIGEEDEENNYYSLGGDNHEDLEEDQA